MEEWKNKAVVCFRLDYLVSDIRAFYDLDYWPARINLTIFIRVVQTGTFLLCTILVPMYWLNLGVPFEEELIYKQFRP